MKRFKNILLVINSKIENETAIQKAAELAKHNQAKITVIEALDEFYNINHFFKSESSTNMLEAHIQEKQNSLQALLEPYRQDIEMGFIISHGKPFIEIIRAVLTHNFDIVIKTCHQHGSLNAMLFGTTDMHLLRKCPCPVWLIKPNDEIKCQSILAAVDIEPSVYNDGEIDPLNLQILQMATSLTRTESAELQIVHAWTVFGESMLKSSNSDYYEEEVAAWIENQKKEIKTGIEKFKVLLDQITQEKGFDILKPKLHFLEGDAYDIIPQLAEKQKVDLVIMGTVARTGLPGFFMGNTAESILNQLNCSVLAIKPEGFVSPVRLDK